MSKKIGIVTMFDYFNFGNRLQNYAVQTVLEKMGFQCETLVPYSLYTAYSKKAFRQFWVNIVCMVAANRICYKHTDAVRLYRIKRFNQNIHVRCIDSSTNFFPPDLAVKFDYFVTGSDQVWNPHFWNILLGDEATYHNHFLLFARPEQRKCFSPSFGITELPQEWKERFYQGLKGFDKLNVRESEGADLIYHLTGQTADVTLDPTLLLSRSEWEKVEREFSSRPKGKYILYIMLGSEAEEITTEQKIILNEIAKKRGLTCCRMMIRKRPEWFACGPGEFIHMIKNAELVCTDSFHCTVFSILFGKPFLLFKRILKKYGIDMSSRTATLLSTLRLERKSPENQVWNEENIFECDYQDNMVRLEHYKEQTINILKKSLS